MFRYTVLEGAAVLDFCMRSGSGYEWVNIVETTII
jgi:hypothetical protein